MNAVPISSPLVSNPTAVMKMIETARVDEGLTALLPAPKKSASIETPRLRLHVDPDDDRSTNPSNNNPLFDLDQPPTRQVEQLVIHLRKRQKELSQREADLQAEVYHWEQQVRLSKSQLQKRSGQLEQHLSQVVQQQKQLSKLQQQMVDGQQTLRLVIERIVDDCEPSNLKIELSKLRTELGERFDSIFSRWETILESHDSMLKEV